MLKLNDKIIKQETFGDKTLKVEIPEKLNRKDGLLGLFASGMFGNATDTYFITWCYDNDSELFLLQCLVDRIRDISPFASIKLEMPYIPNARQDREVSNRLFTLKSFCKIINNMHFSEVKVLDPHSDVSLALLDRVVTELPLKDCCTFGKDVVFMYPDAGAAKKYKDDGNAIIGNKHRNEEGRIDRYDLFNFKEGTKTVMIVDDICSYGGTFVEAAKALKEKGVETICLMVSHCEPNIFKGQVFDYIHRVYTTDSILDYSQMTVQADDTTLSKVEFIKKYREVKEEKEGK